MGLVSGIATYFIIWWTVLFLVLPWGNRPVDDPEPGHVRSAPAKPRLVLKALVTTAVSGVIFAIVWFVIESGWVSFRE